jgi:hypothetical protein
MCVIFILFSGIYLLKFILVKLGSLYVNLPLTLQSNLGHVQNILDPKLPLMFLGRYWPELVQFPPNTGTVSTYESTRRRNPVEHHLHYVNVTAYEK